MRVPQLATCPFAAVASRNSPHPVLPTGISEEDVWQAVHRLGLDDHLALPSPIPLARVPLNECLLEE